MRLAAALLAAATFVTQGQDDGPGTAQEVPSIIRACKYPATADRRLALPGTLREVSGLAWHDGALLAHQDESGRLFRIDPASGTVTKWSALEGNVRDDFEGIAVVDSMAWLMTSRGRLYSLPARASDTPLPWRRVDTGLGKACELEGLGTQPDGILLLPCKAGQGNDVVIHRWDSRAGKAAVPASIRVPATALAKAGVKRLRPSAVEWDPASRHLLVVSSSPAMLLEIDSAGLVVAVVRLTGHPQPEGIALSPGRALFISDEGGSGAASLARYSCDP